MSKKIKPTGRQKSFLLLHVIVFTIGNIIMWSTYKGHSTEWVYPWPAWICAAWALWLLGHFCVIFASYEDKGLQDYKRQEGKA
jgi:hypothetical protein